MTHSRYDGPVRELGRTAIALALASSCVNDAARIACPDGLSYCAETCIDTSFDPAHCGACDIACPASELCSLSQCSTECLGGTLQCGARCVDTQNDPAQDTTGRLPVATVRSSLVELNHEAGIFVGPSETAIDATLVRDTLPQEAAGLFGSGIVVEAYPSMNLATTASVHACVLERNRHLSVFVSAAAATFEATRVSETLPEFANDLQGRGIHIQAASAPITVRDSLIEKSYEAGLFVLDSEAVVDRVLVRDNVTALADGLYGDGISVIRELGAASANVTASRIEASARAGLSNFGAFVSLADTTLLCSAFDLDGESAANTPFAFEDAGGNRCGCPTATGECKLVSAGLAPPPPVAPLE